MKTTINALRQTISSSILSEVINKITYKQLDLTEN